MSPGALCVNGFMALLNDGDYTLGGQYVKVTGNLATLKDGTIAGSVTNLMDCMRTAVLKMIVGAGVGKRYHRPVMQSVDQFHCQNDV